MKNRNPRLNNKEKGGNKHKTMKITIVASEFALFIEIGFADKEQI